LRTILLREWLRDFNSAFLIYDEMLAIGVPGADRIRRAGWMDYATGMPA